MMRKIDLSLRPLRLRPYALAGLAVGSMLGASTASAATCAPNGAVPVDAVRQMYAGLTAGNRDEVLGSFAHDGFMFDGGARFTPEALTELVLKLEAAGTKPQWTVGEAETHTACDLAWSAWTTHGSFTTAAGTQPRTWLESAVFVWRDGSWKIRFFHSTPVPPPK